MQNPCICSTLLLALGVSAACCGFANVALAAEPERQVLQVADHVHIVLDSHHVQGLAISTDSYWISSVERATRQGWIFKVARENNRLVAQRELVDGDRYHPGGMQLVDGAIWVPLAEYRPRSTTTMLRLSAETLETLDDFEVDDHLGAAAADDRGRVHAANWDARQIYTFDAEGQQLAVRDSPTGVAYQDMEWHDDHLWACGHLREGAKRAAVVDRIDLAAGQLVERYELRGTTATVGSNFSREGCAKLADELFLMPEDGPETRIYRFRLSPSD